MLHETGQESRTRSSFSHFGSHDFSTWSVQVHLFQLPLGSPLQLEPDQGVKGSSAHVGRVGSEHATQVPPQPSSAPAGLPEHEQLT